jgi:hypothetical protein
MNSFETSVIIYKLMWHIISEVLYLHHCWENFEPHPSKVTSHCGLVTSRYRQQKHQLVQLMLSLNMTTYCMFQNFLVIFGHVQLSKLKYTNMHCHNIF